MSELAINQTRIDEVSIDVYNYLLDNGLDGFDFDWEFPVWSRDAKWSDKDGFSSILKVFLKN
jgi:GH18 family chitinase